MTRDQALQTIEAGLLNAARHLDTTGHTGTANALIAHLETIRDHIADAFTTRPPDPRPPDPAGDRAHLRGLRPQATEEN